MLVDIGEGKRCQRAAMETKRRETLNITREKRIKICLSKECAT